MKICRLVFVSCFAFAIVALITAQTEAWVSGYEYGIAKDDSAIALAVDGSGNVCVTGRSVSQGQDFDTVCYGTNGAQLWHQRIEYPGTDQPTAIASDAAGNFCVVGFKSVATSSEFLIALYSPNGSQQWLRTYQAGISPKDVATGVSFDPLGNVYVSGRVFDNGNYDFATVSFDPNGGQRWAVRYNSATNLDERASCIAVDSAGNVYVAGTSASATASVIVVVSYDSSGVQRWVRIHKPSARNSAVGIALDNYGNVFVVGNAGSGLASDFTTVSYDKLGALRWASNYAGPNGPDVASGIAVDNALNVYVTGTSRGVGSGSLTGSEDYATICYDTFGAQRWVSRYDGPGADADTAAGIAVDPAGFVYVTGTTTDPKSRRDIATVAYDFSGNRKWVASYNGAASKDDGASAVAVDAAGNVYVTGYSTSATALKDYVTIKYSQPPLPFVRLQTSTPGGPDIGHFNVSGTGKVGLLFASAFRMPTGAANGAVLRSDAFGNASWTAPPWLSGTGNTNFLPKFSSSDTLTNSALFEDGAGHIGIGTTSPAQRLDVAGTIRMSGFSMPTGASNNFVLTSDGAGNGTWKATGTVNGSGTTNRLPKFANSTTLTDSILYESSSGLIGIGTTGPQFKLDVSGTAKMDGFFMGTNAQLNYVLTSDANGLGTWMPATGLTLPYFGTDGSGSDAFVVENHSGGSGLIGRALGGGSGVVGEAPAGGSGVAGIATGGGSGVYGYGQNGGAGVYARQGGGGGPAVTAESLDGNSWAILAVNPAYSSGSFGGSLFVNGRFKTMNGPFEASPSTTLWTTNKPATVKLDDGSQVKLFAEESAEIYFTDYGDGQLNKGRAHIELDPKFLQTVTINAQYPMKAFVQLEGDCNGVFVTNKSQTGFDVVELGRGKSSAAFTYRVVCNRKHYEGERLATEEVDVDYNSRMLNLVWPELLQSTANEIARMRSAPPIIRTKGK